MGDGAISAHGIGGQADLPIPLELAVTGGVAALVVSFAVLVVAWKEPRYDGEASGRPAPGWLARLVDAPAFTTGVRVLGLVVFGYAAFAGIFGKDSLINPVFGFFYVWWWVGLVPLSLLLGPVWKALSPVRTVHLLLARLSGGDPEQGVREYPERLGVWPAAVGLFAFVWMELVYPFGTELGPVRLWCAVYVGIMLVGGAVFGSTFFARADPFEVYSSLVARLSVWGRRDGRLVVRSPLANLDTVTPRAGLLAVVSVLFGSTAFDSFRESSPWVRFTQSSGLSSYHLNNLGLLAFCLAVGVWIALACVAMPVDRMRRTEVPDLMAHSIVPIIVGYIGAHYLTYLVETGQQTLIYASDPLSNGSNLLGTADLSVNFWLSYHPTLLATAKVVLVVLGHVVGVVAAHDRALKVLPERVRLTGQIPLLIAMVVLTGGGLSLLFAA